MFRIGVDIGGTFTDFAVWRDESEGYVEIASQKLPTSRPDFAKAVMDGIDAIIERFAIPQDAPVLVVHGTTVSTNAVIERSEPDIALITTEGYRDILGIARLRLDKPVDLFNRRPTPIVPRERVFEVRERLLADGSVDRPLDEAALIAAIAKARDSGCDTLAICFLHAYRNPVHEKRALTLAAEHFPDMIVMASHEVWPQQSEYERAVLTLLNVYVKRLMEGYIGRIDAALRQRLPYARLYITKSNGGIMSAAEAQRMPIHTLLSGPAAGVTAAQTLGGFLQADSILTLDMGGTSTDVSLVQGGRPMTTGQAEVGDFPILMPVTAIEAIGAGGGSVVWLNEGILKVGPRSAGSKPGPACYGLGGTAPTLTDAYLVAGYLSPKGLLGGKLPLDRTLAEQALSPIAATLGSNAVGAAESAIAVATSNMLAKILPFLARIGVSPSDLTLMLYGGAGGIHGPILAEEIGIRRIIVPRMPSVFCAFGCLVSDLVHDAVRNTHGIALGQQPLADAFCEIEAEGSQWLERQTQDGQILGRDSLRFAEMRYAAQSFTITVNLAEASRGDGGMAAAESAFHEEHERLFGHANRTAPVAIDALRVRTIGRQPKPEARSLPPRDSTVVEPIERRPIHVGGRWRPDTPVFAWGDLPFGSSISGPAIIQQDLATILVPDGFDASVGELGDLDIRKA